MSISHLANFGELIAALTEVKASFSNASDSAMQKAAVDTGNHLAGKIRAMHGTYQEGAGDFPDWAELDSNTQRQRDEKGIDPDRPLYETGEMREAWGVERVSANIIEVFNDTPYAGYHEEGTEHMPQRSTVGIAMIRYDATARAFFERRLRHYMKYKTGRSD